MSDSEYNDLGVHDCGHAVEAHSDANGCELCDCSESLGRDFVAASNNSQGSTVEAPTAEGGAVSNE